MVKVNNNRSRSSKYMVDSCERRLVLLQQYRFRVSKVPNLEEPELSSGGLRLTLITGYST